MKLYAVTQYYGGICECVGVFLALDEALARANDGRFQVMGYDGGTVGVNEVEFHLGEREPNGRKCGICKGDGLSDYNYACPACGGSGQSGT